MAVNASSSLPAMGRITHRKDRLGSEIRSIRKPLQPGTSSDERTSIAWHQHTASIARREEIVIQEAHGRDPHCRRMFAGHLSHSSGDLERVKLS